MSFTFAIAGKGGSGKTSLTCIVIRHILKNKGGPVLAVDADPNANLGESLGLRVQDTVGKMLDQFQRDKIDIPPGITKETYLELKLNSLLVESRGVDLISMGMGEGQGCYCYPNTILRKFIDQLTESYPYIVMDNEAGMEHLSRGTTQDIDELLIVSNHSIKGVRTIGRIKDLVRDLKLRVRHLSIAVNMVPHQLDPAIAAELDKMGINTDAVVPLDPNITDFDLNGKSLLDLPDASLSVRAVDSFMEKVLSRGSAAKS